MRDTLKQLVTIWMVWTVLSFLVLVTATENASADETAGQPANVDAEAILKIHQDLLAAHLSNDASGVLAAESEDPVVVTRGEVLFPTRDDRKQMFEGYLASTEFEQYRDLIDPIVRVSEDGTLGWLICQVEIVGRHKGISGDAAKLNSVWAWVELYEKRDGRWLRIGEVSNVRP
jgi:ketosteroid isomerase-like protein